MCLYCSLSLYCLVEGKSRTFLLPLCLCPCVCIVVCRWCQMYCLEEGKSRTFLLSSCFQKVEVDRIQPRKNIRLRSSRTRSFGESESRRRQRKFKVLTRELQSSLSMYVFLSILCIYIGGKIGGMRGRKSRLRSKWCASSVNWKRIRRNKYAAQ